MKYYKTTLDTYLALKKLLNFNILKSLNIQTAVDSIYLQTGQSALWKVNSDC